MRRSPRSLSKRPNPQDGPAYPAPAVDVLSDVLAHVGLTTRVFCRSELSAPWAMALPASGYAHFHAVERGSCWVQVDRGGKPLALSAGDLVVVPHGLGHRLSDAPGRRALPLEALLANKQGSGACTYVEHGGHGPRTSLICGSFQFARRDGHPLLQLLPQLLVLRGEAGRAPDWLEATLGFLASESRAARPGAQTVMARLTDILFIQVVRAWIEQQRGPQGSWLAALRDERIGAALAAIHERPEHPWTVAGLAWRVGMSRSPFAQRFTACVGEPPLAYVFRWRMQRAADLLRRERTSVAEVASRVGYDSEAAFSKAFKRAMGMAPGAWRRDA